jgi:protein farnesyltransferase/geranylgeranyltransferase type-1 subunit alpha
MVNLCTSGAITSSHKSFVKERIAVAPNNASAWNYLRGILDHDKIPYSELQAFVTPYSLPQPPFGTPPEVVDLENPLPSKEAQLPCVAAIEFMADIYEAAGDDDLMRAAEVRSTYLVDLERKTDLS